MRLPRWAARDWRQFIALSLLAAGNVPLTFVLHEALTVVSANPRNAAALMLGAETGALIAINLIGLSAVLGRRTFKFKVGDQVIEAAGGGAERVLNKAEE